MDVSDLNTNTGKFVTMAEDCDILITKNGKVVAKLVKAKADKITAAKELLTMFPKGADIDLGKAREGRILG